MSALELPELVYRGNFQVVVGIDYAGTILSAEFGSGYREDEVVGLPLLTARLNYEALTRRAFIRPPDSAKPVDRLEYIWNFYCDSKDRGNRPCRMRSPRDERMYLWFFPDDNLTLNMIDAYCATGGLALKQWRGRGVNTLDDGSVADEVVNPDVI
jgi:hypothetical protein